MTIPSKKHIAQWLKGVILLPYYAYHAYWATKKLARAASSSGGGLIVEKNKMEFLKFHCAMG
jgi:hypothetical protein